MKPSKLKLHFSRCHADKDNKDVSYFRALREKLMKKGTLSTSYKISLLIAKTGKPHTIGEELLIPAIAEVVETVLHQRARDVTNKIPLSNDTVQRRINAMAEDVENTLCCFLRQNEFHCKWTNLRCPGTKQFYWPTSAL
uniref:SCAN box domain-containing protein n=1 Tax=Trichuris muris TaxID=70415 RepID=A0A5S6R1W6_TRIMR